MKGLLVLTVISCAFASQDLCLDGVVPAGSTFKFADDPSACDAYLYCHMNGTELESVYQGKCETGYNFKADTATCETAINFPCAAACEFNPAGTAIKIAVAADVTCRSFQTCDGPTVGTTTYDCTSPSVFNRNFGICTAATIAPCSFGESNSVCEVGNNGFFNDESGCDKFIFCNEGEQSNEVCPTGLHFNPTGNFCDNPENLSPLCTDTLAFGPEIPKPPHIGRFGRRF